MIAIAQVATSHGLRGELRLNTLTDSRERFSNLERVWLGRNPSTTEAFHVEQTRVDGTQVVMKLRGIDDRTAASELREQYVFIQDHEVVRPADGSYFIHEVLGMEVSTEQGVAVGTVADVWVTPANDVWVVRGENREVLIPATKEIIKMVDVERRTVVIHAMEGLLD
jgi:16S rRNA processing protein RimM